MLFQEAYILVKEVGISYSDVKGMTRMERSSFIDLYSEDVKRQNDAIERQSNRR